jgi:hypothetical protein
VKYEVIAWGITSGLYLLAVKNKRSLITQTIIDAAAAAAALCEA